MSTPPGAENERLADNSNDATTGVLAAARLVDLAITPDDLAAVTAHLALLRGFATVIGEPDPEPAPVYRP